MTLRICAEPGCPTPSDSARCPTHTTDRSHYKRQHKTERARWEPIVKRGKTPCRRCRKPIQPGQPWDIGRPDDDCDYPTAPEHRACNRATAGR